MKDTKYITHVKNGYQLMIWHNGKSTYYGFYKTLEEAILIRNKTLKLIGHTNTSKTYNTYIDNKEFYKEIVYCKATGILSDKLFKMFYKIIKGVSKKFRYKDEDDRSDCESYAAEVVIKNWHLFNEEFYDNPFAYFSEIIKRGFAHQFKMLQKTRINTISLDYTDEDGNKMINF